MNAGRSQYHFSLTASTQFPALHYSLGQDGYVSGSGPSLENDYPPVEYPPDFGPGPTQSSRYPTESRSHPIIDSAPVFQWNLPPSATTTTINGGMFIGNLDSSHGHGEAGEPLRYSLF
jgi:hypothetical protein